VPAAIIATAASAAAALTTFFASEERSRRRDVMAAAWFELKDAAEVKLLFWLPDDDWIEKRAVPEIEALQRWNARLLRGDSEGVSHRLAGSDLADMRD